MEGLVSLWLCVVSRSLSALVLLSMNLVFLKWNNTNKKSKQVFFVVFFFVFCFLFWCVFHLWNQSVYMKKTPCRRNHGAKKMRVLFSSVAFITSLESVLRKQWRVNAIWLTWNTPYLPLLAFQFACYTSGVLLLIVALLCLVVSFKMVWILASKVNLYYFQRD